MRPRTLAVLSLFAVASPAPADDVASLRSDVERLRSEVTSMALLIQRREERLEALTKGLAALREDIAGLRDRMVSPLAGTFLASPPPSSDSVGMAKVPVFAPRVEVDASRRHDLVSLRLRRIEAGEVKAVGEAEIGQDGNGADLPIDQNGALYVVDWSTSDGHTVSLMLKDGASGQAAATVQIRPLQSQGRFIFVGYRVE